MPEIGFSALGANKFLFCLNSFEMSFSIPPPQKKAWANTNPLITSLLIADPVDLMGNSTLLLTPNKKTSL